MRPDPRLAELAAQLRARGPAPSRVLRVNQLDATVLDGEVVGLLRESLAGALGALRGGLAERFGAELQLALGLLLHAATVMRGRPSPGMQLQSLRFPAGASRLRMAAHTLLTVVAPYAWHRLHQRGLMQGWGAEPEGSPRRRAWALMRRAETTAYALGLLNLVAFLRHGRYRSLAERVLRLRLEHPQQCFQGRAIDFDFQNRDLLFDRLSGLALALLPLVPWSGLRRFARWRPWGSSSSGALAGTGKCAACGEAAPVMPCEAPCGHRACYYCATTLGGTCPQCGGVAGAESWERVGRSK